MRPKTNNAIFLWHIIGSVEALGKYIDKGTKYLHAASAKNTY
jgi:hypothetical protein